MNQRLPLDFSKFVGKTDFRFSLDIFNNDDLWRQYNNQFAYIGDVVGARIWQFVGNITEFETKLNSCNLTITGGYESNPKWNDGNWVRVFLKYNPLSK